MLLPTNDFQPATSHLLATANNPPKIGWTNYIKASFNTSETKLDIIYQINRNIFIKDARCHFGLDSQFEVIKYNDENHLLIYIDNLKDLILKIFNKKNEIIKIYVHKKLFDDVIREIRYFSKKYGYDEKKIFISFFQK